MAHAFINGGTMSGKTFLAQYLARSYRANGYGVIVLDPMDDPSWHADRQFRDMDSFLDCAYKATGCVLFVDEVGQTMGRNPPPRVEWLATRARHWGHKVFFIGQDPTQVKPIIREQCAELFLFRATQKRSEIWAEAFEDVELMNATSLQQYQFIMKRRFEPCKTRKLSLQKTLTTRPVKRAQPVESLPGQPVESLPGA